MKILHICNDFSKQRIYNQLITHLEDFEIEQTVYVPVRTKEEIGKYKNENLRLVNYIYSYILRPYHRILFQLKINTVYKDLINHIEVSKINKIHAHCLFSNGAVALKLKKEKGIPYIVAVRNTDINIFYKYMRHLRKLGLEILKEADKVILITPSYKPLILDKYIPYEDTNDFISKVSIIPNAVESFWIENIKVKEEKPSKIIKLLYVGDFSKNKNVPTLLKCVQKLNKENFDSTLTLVGGGGNGEKGVLKILDSDKSGRIKYLGRVDNREDLLKIYRTHDIFVMASFKETFGVVYLEAMSQGLPVIYTKGQGINGYFEEGLIGYSVKPRDISDITSKIIKIASYEIEKMSTNAIKEVKKFNWPQISKEYFKMYSYRKI
jgi:glycosyltransferase involved in cell wall biosynthesis